MHEKYSVGNCQKDSIFNESSTGKKDVSELTAWLNDFEELESTISRLSTTHSERTGKPRLIKEVEVLLDKLSLNIDPEKISEKSIGGGS